MATPSYSASDVEIAPQAEAYSADDVEIAPAAPPLRPEVQRAISGVPRPAAPVMQEEPFQTSLAPPKLATARGGEGAFTTGQGAQDIRNIGSALRTVATAPAPKGLPSPLAARAGAPVPSQADSGLAARQESLNKGIESGFDLATPAMVAAGIAAPVPALEGVALGYGTSKAAKYGAKAAGLGPEGQRLAENLGWAAAPAPFLEPHVGVEIAPESTRVAGTLFRGKAGAGVAVTPEAVTVKGKVGPFEAAKTFKRGPAAKPAIEPQTIEGEPITRDQAAEFMDKAGWDPNKAREMAAQEKAKVPVQQGERAGSEPAAAQEKPVVAAPKPAPRQAPVRETAVQTSAPVELKASEVEIVPRGTLSAQTEGSNNKDAAEPKYKYRSTQANIPPDSEAHQALETARQRISDSDLAGDGKQVGGDHVTVRYGLQSDDTEGVKKYISSLTPFEAKLGKTQQFKPNEHTEGSAVIQAPVVAPELHEINSKIGDHGDFKESDFPEYIPHVTLAYVRPEKAGRYVGMNVTEGKSFTVKSIGITDRNGNVEEVPLTGAQEPSTGAAALKAGADRVPADTKQLSDLVVSPAFKKQGLSGLDAPAQRSVMSSVISALHDPEIRKVVMRAVPINVVDTLAGLESTAKVALHDKNVLSDLLSGHLKNSVSVRLDTADALVRAVASATAKSPSGSAKVGSNAPNAGAALTTGNEGGGLTAAAHGRNLATSEASRKGENVRKPGAQEAVGVQVGRGEVVSRPEANPPAAGAEVGNTQAAKVERGRVGEVTSPKGAGEKGAQPKTTPAGATYYHGTNSPDDIRSKGFSLGKGEGSSYLGDNDVEGVYLSKSTEPYEEGGQLEGVQEVLPTKVSATKLKTVDGPRGVLDLQKQYGIQPLDEDAPAKLTAALKKDGYEGLDTGNEVAIFDPKHVQLSEKSPAPAKGAERRSDVAERKRVGEMSPEEMKQELLRSHVVDLPNRRAFDEQGKSGAVAMSDADGLKAFNDKYGYDAGNTLLQAKAESLKAAGLDSYHDKGDEFLHRGASEADLSSKLEKAREILRAKTFTVTDQATKDKYELSGLDFSHGSGQDLSSAEAALKAHKSEREARGERARGELRGVTRSELERPAESRTQEVAQPETLQEKEQRLSAESTDAYQRFHRTAKGSPVPGAKIDAELADVRRQLGKKQLWERTREEIERVGETTVEGHKDLIRRALAAGKPVPPEVLKDYPEFSPGRAKEVKAAARESDLERDIKDLREQAKKVSEEFSLQSLKGYDPHSPLRAKYNQLLKDAGEREDELARLRGGPTRAEKRDAQKQAADKSFRERPAKAMKYGETEQSQHWQVLEPDFIDKRFQQEIDRYKRAIPEQEQKIKDLGPKTGAQKVSLEKATLQMWKKIQEDNEAHDPRKAQRFKEEYRKLVKEAVSKGRPVPNEVISQHSEFELAQDARERYEKGRHTSFANRSAAINDTMQKEEGFKVKRQDGKPITDEQIKEISTGVDEMVKVLGPELRDMMRGTDLTIAHTSGKHPFLSDAGGQYHPKEKSISAGINNFLGKPIKALAHETGHWLDFEAGRILNSKAYIRPKSGGPSTETQFVSEADRSTKPLYELARRTMSDTYRVQKLIKTTKLSDLPDDQREEIEVMKVVLGPYWHEPRELWARMFEQYVATKLGAGGVSVRTPGQYLTAAAYWPKEAWAKIEPLFEEALSARMDAMRERHAPATIQGVSESEPAPAPPPAAPVPTPSRPVREVEQPRREVISTAKPEYAAKQQIMGTRGNETKLLTSDGEHPARYRVVEASTLQTSHNPQTFAKNPNYPTGVQERAYDTSKEAQNRVIEQAQKYDPNYTINTNPDAVNGPPVMTPDGIVLGGNSRAMSTTRLYKSGNGNQYKGALIAQAKTFGIDKDMVRMMKEPVLVREIAAPKTVDEMRGIGSQLNKSMTGALGVSERAVSAGKAITRDTMNSIAAIIDRLGNDASLRDAMREKGGLIVDLLVKDGAITARERPQFVDTTTGGLSEEGKTFVERALLGSVVDDPRLMDSAPKSVLNKLDSSLAALSSLSPRTDAYNILPLVREALREHSEIAQRGVPVEDYLGQSSLFGGGRNPAVDALVRALAEKSSAVKGKLRQFAQDANADVQGQGMLALGPQPSPSDAFNTAFGTNLTDTDLENSIIQSAQSESIMGVPNDSGIQGEASKSAGTVQQPAAGEARPSSQGTAKATRPQEEAQLGLLSSEPPKVVPGARSAFTGKETGTSTIQDLTDSIKRQVGEKTSLKNRLSAGANIGEQAADAKDAVSSALGKLQGAAAALWDAYARPPKWTDYEDATGKWSGADQVNALDLERFTKAIKDAVPDKVKREAISNWIEAGGDDDILLKRADASSAPYKSGYEAALELTDAEKTIARNVMNRNDATLEEAQKAGLLREGVENYVRHIYADNPKMVARVAAEMNFNSLQTKPSFTKQRKIPTYFDAEQLGFKPKDKDVGFLTASHERAFREALAARDYVKSLMEGEADDGRPLVATSWASAKELPPGEGEGSEAYLVKPNIRPDEEFADYRRVDHPALRGWRWAGKTEEGAPIFVQGDALVHPDIYAKLRNNLGKSAIRSFQMEIGGHAFKPGAALLNVSSEIKHAILSFSGFHQTTLGIHALEHRTAPVGMPALDLTQPDQRFLVDHSLMVAQYDAMEAFGEGVASGGLITKIPLIGPLYHTYVDYLFKDYLPRVKMSMGLHALERNRRIFGGKMSDDQIGYLTASQANAAFGGLNYKMLGRNKTLQDVLRLTFMAPDFTEARARFSAQAAKPYGREQLVALLGGAVALYVLARMLNEMLDKEAHWDKPFSLVYNKKEYSLRTVQGDDWKALTEPVQFVRNRLSPLASTAVMAAEGRDRFGKKQSLGELAKDVARNQVPIPAQAWTKQSSDTNAHRALSTILKMVGINEAQAKTKAEKLAADIFNDSYAGDRAITAEQRQRYMRRHELIAEGTNGNWKPMEDALAQGAIDHREANLIRRDVKLGPLASKVNSFKYADFMKVYEAATPEEKKQLEPVRHRKRETLMKTGRAKELELAQ